MLFPFTSFQLVKAAGWRSRGISPLPASVKKSGTGTPDFPEPATIHEGGRHNKIILFLIQLLARMRPGRSLERKEVLNKCSMA
jgi:hypothetical protein